METNVIFSIGTKNIDKLPFYITGIGIDYEENGVNRKEGLEDYQWSYCVEGEGIFNIDGQSYKISKGMAFFFRKGVPHSYKGITGKWKMNWVTFNGAQVESLMDYMEIGSSFIVTLDEESEIRQKYHQIFKTLIRGDYSKESMLKISLQLYELNVYMQKNKEPNENPRKNRDYQRLSPIIQYMKRHYQEDITLEELAEQIGVTKYYLCRLFKETYDSKPFDYLNQIRIQKAKEYLATQGQMKIKEIGEQVGYNDTSYFCYKFKAHEGCSPVEFRRKYSVNS